MLSGQFTNKTLRRWTDRQTCAVLVVYYTSLTSIGMQKLHIFAFHLAHRSLTYHKIYFFTPGGTKRENAKLLLYSRVHNHRTEQLLIYFPFILKISWLFLQYFYRRPNFSLFYIQRQTITVALVSIWMHAFALKIRSDSKVNIQLCSYCSNF